MIMMSLTMSDCVLATQALKLFPVKHNHHVPNPSHTRKSRQDIQEENKKEVPTGVVSLVFPRSALLLMYLYATYKRMKAGCKNKIKNFVDKINATTNS